MRVFWKELTCGHYVVASRTVVHIWCGKCRKMQTAIRTGSELKK